MGPAKQELCEKTPTLLPFSHFSSFEKKLKAMAGSGNEATEDDTPQPTPTPTPTPMTSLSSSSEAASRHVVVVMDGMQEFTTEPLEWALENVIKPGCVLTLIGAMPWLNIPC